MPVVVVANPVEPSLVNQVVRAGATDCLQKPSTAEGYAVLGAKIRAFVEQARSDRSEDRLSTPQGWLERALETTNTYTFDWVPTSGVIRRHPAFENLFGTDSEGAKPVFDAYFDFVRADHRDRVKERTRAAIDDGTGYDLVYPIDPQHGENRWVREQAEVVQADDGTIRVVGTVTDVTDLKRYERRLARQNDRLETFLSMVSHDLRNPLNVAVGRVELAQEECTNEHLADAAAALERSQNLIEQLLTLAREGRQPESLDAVSLSTVAEGCWETVATREATLVVETDRTITAEPGRLKQLFENLFRNAVGHGGEDVTVRVGAIPDGFYVADTGDGIPPSERESVFDPSYSTTTDGTGFGLAIVREIAEAHDWSVAVTDSETGGARFDITGVDVLE